MRLRRRVFFTLLLLGCDAPPAAVPPDAGPTLTLSGTILELTGGVPAAPIEVCVASVCTTTAADGSYALDGVPANAEIAVTLDDASETYQPTLLPIRVGAVDATFSPRLLLLAFAESLDAMVGVTPDPTRSNVIFFAAAATGAGLPGVSVEIVPNDAEVRAYMSTSLAPSTTATETTASGLGIFVHVPLGDHGLRFSYMGAACGTSMGSWAGPTPDELRTPVVAGYWTVVGAGGCAP